MSHTFASDGRSKCFEACHEHPASRWETGRGRLCPMPAVMAMSHNQLRLGQQRGEKAWRQAAERILLTPRNRPILCRVGTRKIARARSRALRTDSTKAVHANRDYLGRKSISDDLYLPPVPTEGGRPHSSHRKDLDDLRPLSHPHGGVT